MIFNPICNREKLAEDKASFVGVSMQIDENGQRKPHVTFPMHFEFTNYDGEELSDANSKKLRTEIRLLLSVMSACKNDTQYNRFEDEQEDTYSFPYLDFLRVIRFFLSNGLLFEQEKQYKIHNSGKISWSKTIKQVSPIVSNGSVIYPRFVASKRVLYEDELIVKLYQYCVYESFNKIGWLYTDWMPRKPQLEITSANKARYLTILRKQFAETFDDKKRSLFKSMIAIIQSIDFNTSNLNGMWNYGTNHFEYVWEWMIDNVYGNAIEKENCQPKGFWYLPKKKEPASRELRPDTIMHQNNSENWYVIDAKYYRNASSDSSDNLPGSADINKQITYASEVNWNLQRPGQNQRVYNSFVIPQSFTSRDDNRYVKYETFGYATGSWLENKDTKETIDWVSGIFIDTKFLMEEVMKSSSHSVEIGELSNFIKDCWEEFRQNGELYFPKSI
ncbi:MAG: LlaJI family restriction endonuclease [Methanobrevibacter sp. CfCl-M3]